MDVIFGLIPGMIILGLIGVGIFFWAVKNGQYEDMDGPAYRILDDDDLNQYHRSKKENNSNTKPDQSKSGENEKGKNR